MPNPKPNKPRCIADLTFTAATQLTFLDVAVTNPSTLSAPSRNGMPVIGSAAAHKETEKNGKYKSSYGEEILRHLIPFVVESTGRLGTAAETFIESMVKRTRVDPRYDQKAKAAKLLLSRQIAATLVEYNSRIFRTVQNKSKMVAAN